MFNVAIVQILTNNTMKIILPEIYGTKTDTNSLFRYLENLVAAINHDKVIKLIIVNVIQKSILTGFVEDLVSISKNNESKVISQPMSFTPSLNFNMT